MSPVVDEDGECDGDDDEDADCHDDGGEVAVQDAPALGGGPQVRDEGVGEAAAVAGLQDVLPDGVRVVDVTSQLAAVHNFGLVIAHPRSVTRIICNFLLGAWGRGRK